MPSTWSFFKSQKNQKDDNPKPDIDYSWLPSGNTSTPVHPHNIVRPKVLDHVFVEHPNMSIFRNQSKHTTTASSIATPHPPGDFGEALPPRSVSPTKPESPRKRLLRKFSLSPKKKGRDLEPEFDIVDIDAAVGNETLPEVVAEPNVALEEEEAPVFTSPSPAPSSHPSSGTTMSPFESPAADRAMRLQQFGSSVSRTSATEDALPSSPLPSSLMRANSFPQTPGARSILRPPQTPGTGQSVRFGAQNAYRIISPNTTTTSTSSSRIENQSVERLLSVRMDDSVDIVELSVSDVGDHTSGTGEAFNPAVSGSGSASSTGHHLPSTSPTAPLARNMQSSDQVLSPHASSRGGNASISSIGIPALPEDMSNLNDFNILGEMEGVPTDSVSETEVPPFAAHSPAGTNQRASRDDELFEPHNESNANATAFFSAAGTPSVTVASPGYAVTPGEETQFLSFVDSPLGNDSPAPTRHSTPSPSPRMKTDTAMLLSNVGTPLNSTPDASAYLSLADISTSLVRIHDGPSYDTRLRTPSPTRANEQAEASLSVAAAQPLPESPMMEAVATPAHPSSEPPSSYMPGRVFSRSNQPVEGIIAAVPERSRRALSMAAIATPDVTLADLMVPGKFESSSKLDPPEPASTAPSPVPSDTELSVGEPDNGGSSTIGQIIAAQHEIIHHLQGQVQALNGMDAAHDAERAQWQSVVESLKDDLRAVLQLWENGPHDGASDAGREGGVLTEELDTARDEAPLVRESVNGRLADEAAWKKEKRTIQQGLADRTKLWNDNLRDLQDRVEQADRDKHLALKERDDAREELRQRVNGSPDMEAEILALCDDLTNKNAEMAELRSQIAALAQKDEEITLLRDELRLSQGKEEEMAALRDQLDAFKGTEAELQSLRAAISASRAVESELVSLREQLAQSEATAKELEVLQVRVGELEAQTLEIPELRAKARSAEATEAKLSALTAELDAQWSHAEQATETIQQLEGDKLKLAAEVGGLKEVMTAQAKELEATAKDANDAQAAIQELEAEKQSLVAQVESVTKEAKAKYEEDRATRLDLAKELREAWEKNAALEEKEKLATILQEELDNERFKLQTLVEQHEADREADHEELVQANDDLNRLQEELEENAQARERLEELLHERDEELSATADRVLEREQEADKLRGEVTRVRRECDRELEEQKRKLTEVNGRAEEAKTAMDDMIRKRATEDVTSEGLKSRVQGLMEEISKLRKQVHDLQAESADKEVKLVQLAKSKQQYKEDKEGLNLALEAKQQELDLLKRKYGVKGVAGGTPAINRVARPPSRESMAFSTPLPPSGSRGALASSTASKDLRDRRTTLGPVDPLRSSLRASTTAVPPSTTKVARRTSIITPATPASAKPNPLPRSQSSLANSVSESRRTSVSTTASTHRRASSSLALPSRARIPVSLRGPSPMQQLQSAEDKENINEEPSEEAAEKGSRRRTMLPA